MADAGKGAEIVAESRKFVKFDDQIILFDPTSGGKDAAGGYVHANGLIDQSVYINGLKPQDGAGQPVPPNLRECRFTVCPKLQYTAARALERAQENGKLSSSQMKIKHDLFEEELLANDAEGPRMAGEPLHYGLTVQLQHSASGKYLTLLRTRAELDTSALKLEVTEGGDENSWWKVMPAYKSKKEGERVAPGDTVELVSEKVDKHGIVCSRHAVAASGLHDYVAKRYEVNAGVDSTKLRVVPCAQSAKVLDLDVSTPDTKNTLKGGDSITFFHRETESYLMFDKDLGSEPFFKFTPSGSTLAKDSNSLWKVESDEVEWEGDLVPWNQKGNTSTRYRIKHLASNKYLGVSKMGSMTARGLDGHTPKLKMTEDYMNPDMCTVWTFLPFETEPGPVITFESLLYLQNETLAKTVNTAAAMPSYLSHSGVPYALREADSALESNAEKKFGSIKSGIKSGGLIKSFGAKKKQTLGDKMGSVVSQATMAAAAEKVDTFQTSLLSYQDTKDAMDLDLVEDTMVVELIFTRSSIDTLRSYAADLKPCEPFDNRLDQDEIMEWLKSSELRAVVFKHQAKVQNVLSSIILACTESENSDPLSREGTANPLQQRLFLEQGAIRTIVGILEETFAHKKVPRWAITLRALGQGFVRMGQLSFRFLRQVVKDNPSNKRVLARHINLLLDQLGSEMKTANVLTELYKSNLELLKAVDDEQIMQYIRLLKDTPFPRFLSFLSVLCVSDGVPIPENQRKIVDLLIVKNDRLLVPCQLVREGKRAVEVMLSHVDGSKFKLSSLTATADVFMNKDTADMSRDQLRMAYFLKVLDVYHDVCRGRNRAGTDVLVGRSDQLGIGYESLVAMIAMESIPTRVRQQVVRLMMCLYIDREPQEPLSFIKLVRIWSPVRPSSIPERTKVNPYEKFPLKAPTNGFPELKMLILSFFGSINDRAASGKQLTVSELDLMRNMLAMCVQLMHFGFYHQAGENSTSDLDKVPHFGEIKDLIGVLLPCLRQDANNLNNLSGTLRRGSIVRRGSVASAGPTAAVAAFSESFSTSMEVKIKICRLLEMAFDCRMDRRMTMLMEEYERIFLHAFPDVAPVSSMTKGVKGVSRPEGKVRGTHKVAPYAEVQAKVLRKTYPYLQGDSEISDIWAKEKFSSVIDSMFSKPIIGPEVMGNPDIYNPPTIVQALVKCINFRYPRLTAIAFALLNRHMTQKAALMTRCKEVQILVYPEVVRMFYDVHVDVSEVRRQTKWLGSDDSVAKENAYAQITAVLKKMRDLCTPGSTVVVAGRDMHIDDETIVKSQNILRNLNAHMYILNILRMPIDRRSKLADDLGGPQLDISVEKEKLQLFNLAYSMLASFCSGNDRNQRVMYPFIKDRNCFMFHMGIEGLNVAAALSAIFCNNVRLCDNVEEGVIMQIFDLLTKHGRMARWLRLLIDLVVVDGKPNRRNQDLILKAVMNFQTTVMDLCLLPDQHNRRIELMQDRDCDKEMGSELRYHCMCVQLLADCCKGSNPGAEVKARSCIPLEAVMKTLIDLCHPIMPDGMRGDRVYVDPDVQRVVRSSYVYFLHEVFLDSRTDSVLKQLADAHNRFWAVDKETFPDWEDRFGGSFLIPMLLQDMQKLCKQLRGTDFADSSDDSDDVESSDESDSDDDGREATPSQIQMKRYKDGKSPTGRKDLLKVASRAAGVTGADSSEFEGYVCDAVAPMLTQYYEAALLQSPTSEQERVKASIGECAAELMKLVMLDSSPAKLVHLLSAIDMSSVATEAAEDGAGDDGPDIAAIEGLDPLETLGELFKGGWPDLFASVAQKLGIHDVTSDNVMGPGFRDLAEMISQNDLVPKVQINGHATHYRQVIQNLCGLASETRPPEQMTDNEGSLHALILDFLRCMIHMEDPNIKTRGADILNESWERFLSAQDPEKTEPAVEVLAYVQNKYNDLGATEAALVGLVHKEETVRQAAVRLLLCLLSGGNTSVQDTVYASVTRSRNEAFVASLHDGIRGGKELIKEYDKIHTELERQQMMALLTSRLSVRKSKRNGGKVSAGQMMSMRMATQRTQRGMTARGVMADGKGVDVATNSFFIDCVKLVEYMTEGHHANLQNYMCRQPQNKGEFNLIAEIVSVLEELHPACTEAITNLDDCMLQMSIHCARSLSEATQGPCTANQDYLASSPLLVVVDRFFNSNQYTLPDDNFDPSARDFVGENIVNGKKGVTTYDVKNELNNALLVVLQALLEGCNTKEKPERMIQMLNASNFVEHMILNHRLLSMRGKPSSGRNAADFDEAAQLWLVYDCFNRETRQEVLEDELFSIHFLLRFISDYDKVTNTTGPAKALSDLPEIAPELFDYMQDSVASIEVLREDQLERVYFRQPEVILRFKKNAVFRAEAEARMYNVVRDNPQEKAEGFLLKIKELQIQIALRESIEKSTWFFWTIKLKSTVESYSLYTTLALLVYMMLVYGNKTDPWSYGKEIDGHAWILFALRALHLLTSLLLCVCYFKVDGPRNVRFMRLSNQVEANKELQREHSVDVDDDESRGGDDGQTTSTDGTWLDFSGDASPPPPEPEYEMSWIVSTVFYYKDLFFGLGASSFMPYYFLAYLIASAYGFYSTQFSDVKDASCYLDYDRCVGIEVGVFIYAFHVLDIFRMPTGMVVFQSIIEGGPGLLSTFGVSLMVVLFFGTFSFVFYQNEVHVCDTFFQCVVYHVIVGMSSGDSLREVFGINGNEDDSIIPTSMQTIVTGEGSDRKDILRTLYVFLFFVVWIILLQGIITGQIVDAFVTLRDDANEKADDLVQRCFICSQERHAFERVGGFIKHIESEHDPWAYLSYANLLREKDAMDYNGLESHIVDMFNRDSAGFLPVSRAMSLDLLTSLSSDPFSNLGDKFTHRFNDLEKKVDSVSNQMTKMDEVLEKVLAYVSDVPVDV